MSTEKIGSLEPPKFTPTALSSWEALQQADGMARSLQEIAAAKEAWIESSLSRIIPAELFNALRAVRRKERKPRNILLRVQRWMAQNKVEIQEHPDSSVITMGGKPVSEFRVQAAGGGLEAQERVFPALPQAP